jgi:methyl-accepting chemotaxis protein
MTAKKITSMHEAVETVAKTVAELAEETANVMQAHNESIVSIMKTSREMMHSMGDLAEGIEKLSKRLRALEERIERGY